MKKLCISVILLLIILPGFSQRVKMKKIFNGKNLKGWVVPENNIWWNVSDGILSVENGPDLKGSILWTEKEYEDFLLETDFKYGKGVVDSGIFLRTEKEQIQMGISGSKKRDMTASLYVAGKGYPLEATGVAKLLKPNDWNTMKIKAKGKLYEVWLNGEKVFSYKSEGALEKGPVGLQLHPGNEMSIEFKNIKIGTL